MGDRSYNLSVLQNRASAHSLHDPAGLGKQHRISHRQGNILVTVIFISKLRDLDIIKCSCSVKGRINLCRSFLYFLLEGDRIFHRLCHITFSGCIQTCLYDHFIPAVSFGRFTKASIYPGFCIFFDPAKVILFIKAENTCQFSRLCTIRCMDCQNTGIINTAFGKCQKLSDVSICNAMSQCTEMSVCRLISHCSDSLCTVSDPDTDLIDSFFALQRRKTYL